MRAHNVLRPRSRSVKDVFEVEEKERGGEKMKKQLAQRLCIMALGLGLAFLGMPGQAKALTSGICNIDLPGACSATVTLSGDALTISVTNTSPVIHGGYITAVAFNLDGLLAKINTFTTDPVYSTFALYPTPPSVGASFSVTPFGVREFVVSTGTTIPGDEWIGSNGPSVTGIPTGPFNTGTFGFTLATATHPLVTEATVAGSMAIRFRDFTPHEVPPYRGGDRDLLASVTSVPEPSSLLFLGAGLLGLGVWAIRKSTNDQV